MTVEDTMVNRDKAGELKRVLEKVFHERCGLPVEVEYDMLPSGPCQSVHSERICRPAGSRAHDGEGGGSAGS
ncbi:MAG: hypothetical protein ACLSE4_07355 [Clostridium sp.]